MRSRLDTQSFMRGTVAAIAVSAAFAVFSTLATAGVLTYGDEDALGTGAYGASDPTAGATLQGLVAGATTQATNSYGHAFPFSPSPGDFLGTDQIYVGSIQTGAHDGYSTFAGRVNGPQIITMDYSSLIPAGATLLTLTLGIAADDFQFPPFGQPYTANLNGGTAAGLTSMLDTLDLTGPTVHFFTIGLDPTLDNSTHILTLSINEGGDGGDGWAIDFLTVGVTTRTGTAPEPASLALVVLGLACAGFARRHRS